MKRLQTKKLGEVCTIVNGSTPLRSEKEFWNNGNISWFTVDDIREQGRIINFTKQKITSKALEKTSVRLLPPDSILLCCTASVGEYAITKIPLTNNQQFNGLVIKDRETLDPFFLFYYASTLTKQLLGLSGKTTIDFIPISRLKEVEITLPSLSEQKRLVKILDEVFEEMGKAKGNAEKNLRNSRELFEAYLQRVFEGKREGWEERRLGDKKLLTIIDGDRGKNYPKKSDFLDEGYCLFLNTKNVRPDGFRFKNTMFITKEKDSALGNGKLQRDDVIMTTRGTIGNLGLYNDGIEFNNIRINSGMLIFRPDLKIISPEYLFEVFRSGIFKIQMKKHTSGAAQPQLPIKTLINFTIPVPKSLSEQKAIVKKLDALSEETKKLEELYKKEIADLEELKKSVLQKAFRGEL